MPLWFFIALTCALFTAACDATSKRIMRENDEWITGTIILGLSSFLLVPIVSFNEFKPFSFDLLALLLVTTPLEVLGYYFFLAAVRLAPLSLVLPLLALTPVLTMLTAFVLLGEHVSGSGFAGIGLVTVGAYLLYSDPSQFALTRPIKAVFESPGARRMLVSTAIWALTSTLGKKGILMYGAMPFCFLVLIGVTTVFAIIAIFRIRSGVARVKSTAMNAYLFCLAGVLMAAAQITHFVSLSMAPVAYMISVKRTSMVFGVLLGWFFFDESHIRFRLMASSIMLAGLFLLYQ